jgi:hypothetical protein
VLELANITNAIKLENSGLFTAIAVAGVRIGKYN